MENEILYTPQQAEEIARKAALYAIEQFTSAMNLDNGTARSNSPETPRETMTVSDAADYVGISKPKMYELIRIGQIRSIKIGRKILVSRQSLLNWIQGGN